MAALSEKGSSEYVDDPFTFERKSGVADVVRLQESRGSQASSTEGTLTLSATSEVVEISRHISFSSMINIYIVPSALVGTDRAAAMSCGGRA